MKNQSRNIPQIGKVEWIGIRSNKEKEVTSVDSILVKKKSGLEGAHFKENLTDKRQVTLIQQEHLIAVASILGKKNIDPKLTRRNIMVSGINLLSLKHHQFKIGDVILKTTGICAPCNVMEENLGPGGYNAMIGHGGITANVIFEGKIKLGDKVELS